MNNAKEIEIIQKGFAENPVLVEQYKKTKAAFRKAEAQLMLEVCGIQDMLEYWPHVIFEKQFALLEYESITLDELKKLSCSGKQLPKQGVKYHLSEKVKQKTIEDYPEQWQAFLFVADRVGGNGISMSIQQFVIID